MKKLSVALATLTVLAGGVYADVTSVNIVGVDTITLEPGKRYIAAAKFYEPGGDGTNTLIKIFGTNQLVQSANYLGADRVTVWDTAAGKYQSYAQYTDGVFYRCNDMDEWNAGIVADNDVIPTGSSFWIVHPATSGTNEVTLTGEVLGGSSDTQDVAIVTGYQLTSYPYAAEIKIQDIAKQSDGATGNANYLGADRIVIWDTDAQKYQAYGLYDVDDTWYKCNDMDEWNAGIVASNSVPVSSGYWYISQTDYTLSKGCPYSSAY